MYCVYQGNIDEVAVVSELIWESLMAVLTGLHTPPTRPKVISIICIDEKQFGKFDEVFRREGKQLQMLSEAEVCHK